MLIFLTHRGKKNLIKMICHELVFPSHHKCKYQKGGRQERREAGGGKETGREGKCEDRRGGEDNEWKGR